MKQSFLDSLVGLDITTVQKLLEENNLKTMIVGSNDILPLIARGKTVILTTKDDEGQWIESATAGDPCEVENDA